jgi:putative pyruvate formate lyase activating enzyme
MGRPVSAGEFADLCLALQERGAENINLVTGSHAAPALASGLLAARSRGLSIPVLWNSSAYEGQAALEPLKDLVDVFLPDLKLLDPALAGRYFRAEDYPETALRAIGWMLDVCGTLRYDRRGVLVSGVVIRHLALPGHGEASREVIRWFARYARGRALLSLMTQYTPPGKSGPAPENLPPGRFLRRDEYDALLRWLEEFGVEDGFLQEPLQDDSWLPDFSRTNPFASELSVPVWHWKTGFAAGV